MYYGLADFDYAATVTSKVVRTVKVNVVIDRIPGVAF